MDDSLNSYWTKALIMLEPDFSSVAFQSIIEPLIPISYTNKNFVLKATEKFSKDVIIQRYLPQLVKALNFVLDENITVEVVTEKDINQRVDLDASEKLPQKIINYYDKFIFDSFIPGNNSNLAYGAALAVAKDPSHIYNPLFIYGGVGLGKTHLMYAIYNYVKEHFPDKKVLYCTSEEFTNELITSIGHGGGFTKSPKTGTSGFRNKYRDADVFLIDDIQFLMGKEGSQEELFHTFNALQNNKTQIVISSDQPPSKLALLEERLSSRFAQGLIVDISLPDFETRSAILKKKAELDNIIVSDDVINFISKNIVSNIRELEGALTRVSAYCRLTGNEITYQLAEIALKDIINKPHKQEITIPFIQEVVANHFNITVEDIRGKKRPSNIAYARQIAMFLSCKLTDDTLTKIGKEYFGGRDHSTVHYGSKIISKDVSVNNETKELILELESKLKCE